MTRKTEKNEKKKKNEKNGCHLSLSLFKASIDILDTNLKLVCKH